MEESHFSNFSQWQNAPLTLFDESGSYSDSCVIHFTIPKLLISKQERKYYCKLDWKFLKTPGVHSEATPMNAILES